MADKKWQGRVGPRWIVAATWVLVLAATAARADERDQRIQRLEDMVKGLTKEVSDLKQQRPSHEEQLTGKEVRELRVLAKELEDSAPRRWLDPDSWLNRLELGGYGEIHANLSEGKTSDQIDIHRLVLYAGYSFADWIKLNVEAEIEHAYVTDGAGGELSLEQAYVDLNLCEGFNIRIGRVLTPVGIVNQRHEPTRFNGVERPSFAKYVVPSTWSSDGVGVFGRPVEWLTYELYVVGGLDGSKFNAKDGIRKGRIKERPSLHEPALTGRVDLFPLAGGAAPPGQDLRVGFSTFLGGVDNGNEGKNPDVDGCVRLVSADFEYSIGRVDLRGAVAWIDIDGAKDLGHGTAKGIFGWYAEAAAHVLPDAWKRGKLAKSDLIVFARYDWYDTQHRMPSGVARNSAAQRQEVTIGLTWLLTPQFTIKADYQIRCNDAGTDLDNLLNFGVGWAF